MGLLLVGSVLTGCQSTPSENIVTEKDTDKLLDMANGKGKEGDSSSKISELGVPDIYQVSFQNEPCDIVVNVDASVTVPEVEHMSIYAVEEDEMTQEMLSQFIAVMTDGAEIYSIPSSPSHIEDIESKLEVFRAEKEAGKEYLEGGEIPLDEIIRNSEETLEYLKANLTSQKIDSTMQVENGRNSYSGRTTIDGMEYMISYGKYESGEELRFFAQSLDTWNPLGEKVTPPDYEISSERMGQVEQWITELGYENMTCVYQSNVQTEDCPDGASDAYRFLYMRSYDGADSVFINGIDSGEEYVYEAPITDEYIEVILTEDALAEFNCFSPQHVTSTVVEQAELLSFEEVCDVFEKMMLVKYPTGTGENQEYKVDKITLGYKKIRTSAEDDYMMVPVWDFNGDCVSRSVESGEEWENYNLNMSHLTINAIDGTIINDRIVF